MPLILMIPASADEMEQDATESELSKLSCHSRVFLLFQIPIFFIRITLVRRLAAMDLRPEKAKVKSRIEAPWIYQNRELRYDHCECAQLGSGLFEELRC